MRSEGSSTPKSGREEQATAIHAAGVRFGCHYLRRRRAPRRCRRATDVTARGHLTVYGYTSNADPFLKWPERRLLPTPFNKKPYWRGSCFRNGAMNNLKQSRNRLGLRLSVSVILLA